MKRFIKIAVIYSVFMFSVLFIISISYKSLKMESDIPSSYSDQQLQIYKQLWESMNESADMFREQTMMFALYTWGFLLLAGYVVLIYIYYKDIKPMVELQKFSKEIAKGNLEIPLPITSNNGFVEFTESFDLMRESLKESKLREIEAENAKKQLVAELSHDLKTPVATIQATCEVLQVQLDRKKEALANGDLSGGVDIDKVEEEVGYIAKKADTINELVQSVFHATIDDMKEVSINVDEYASTMIEGFITDLTEYGKIILDNHIPECLIYMDKLRMIQVIDNVIGNSYKYAGTDIHVGFKETEEMVNADGKKCRFIKITIRDNGPGVKEEEMPLIVEKYYRGNNSKEKTGYGLGMYLVKLYMEKQGGGFEYYNDNGFVVELLVKKV